MSSQNELCDIAVEMSRPFTFEYCLGLLASCDGLVLLYLNASGDIEYEGFLCLWNPTTREYKEMPRSPNQDYERDIGIYGFGYDYNIDDYKVFKIVDVIGETIAEVYTLGLDSWKSIQTIPYRFDANRTPGVLVNGSLHWLGEAGDEDIFNTIVSLDISNYRFQEVKLPKGTLEDGHLFGNVELLEGCLCVLSYIDKVCYEVWVMQDYGVQESWTKRYVISHERIMDDSFLSIMWTFMKSDEILLQGQNGLVLYDLGHSSATVPKIGAFGVIGVLKFTESLVSLNSSTFMGEEKPRRNNINMKKSPKKNHTSGLKAVGIRGK